MNTSPHRARKRFGQNFLRDEGIVNSIIAAIHPQPGDHLVEIGPGQGALTGYLSASGCAPVRTARSSKRQPSGCASAAAAAGERCVGGA